MLPTVLWTLSGVSLGCVTSIFIDDVYHYYCSKRISNFGKCGIIIFITISSFIRGYNDNLITNLVKK
jgi:hypothetical protein